MSDPSTAATLALLGAAALLLLHRYLPWPSVQASRFGGALLFGLPSAPFAALGLPEARPALAFLALVAFVVLPVVLLSARRPSHLESYPLDRRASWDGRARRVNAAGWACYLLGYELFFRGLVLELPRAAFGEWPALATMTALYVAAHLPRPAGEAIGTLPMGLLFGGVTLASGSIWPAYLGHLMIAIASDEAAIRGRRASSP